jgi:hypothetical protein
MKAFIAFTGIAISFALSLPANAASGVLQGCIVYDDRRITCNTTDVHSLHTSCGVNNRPLAEVRVELEGVFGAVIGSGSTGSDGCFSFAFDDFWSGFPMANRPLRVIYKNVDDFYITNASGTQMSTTFPVTINASPSPFNVGTKDVETVSAAQVYATAEEIWDRIVDPIATLSARMTAVRISIGDVASVTSGRNHPRISDGSEIGAVNPVAHEIGHAITMHALNEDVYYPAECDVPAGYFGEQECERKAWHEGFANFFSAVFSWHNNATNALRATSPLETVNESDCVGLDYRVNACHTATLWDIYDDPIGDDDPIDDANNVTLTTMVAVLDHYPGGCFSPAEHCSNEGGLHGNNHWDFLFNFGDLLGSSQTDEIRDIYDQHGLDEGGAGIF